MRPMERRWLCPAHGARSWQGQDESLNVSPPLVVLLESNAMSRLPLSLTPGTVHVERVSDKYESRCVCARVKCVTVSLLNLVAVRATQLCALAILGAHSREIRPSEHYCFPRRTVSSPGRGQLP